MCVSSVVFNIPMCLIYINKVRNMFIFYLTFYVRYPFVTSTFIASIEIFMIISNYFGFFEGEELSKVSPVLLVPVVDAVPTQGAVVSWNEGGVESNGKSSIEKQHPLLILPSVSMVGISPSISISSKLSSLTDTDDTNLEYDKTIFHCTQ